MTASQLVVDLPPTLGADEARVLLAAALFDRNRLSLGQAAEMAGSSKGAFPEVLSHLGVDVLKADVGELEAEVAARRDRSAGPP